jgi:hypothetical protein
LRHSPAYVGDVFGTVIMLAMLLTVSGIVLAHERVDHDRFRFVVGWAFEPALEGQKNAIELRVSTLQNGQPLTGLEKTLQVEFRYSEARARGKLQAVATTPGLYLADLTPTRAGVYEFRLRGTVENVEIEVTFKSDEVLTVAESQFPDRLPSPREVAGVVRSAQETARTAHGAAAASRVLAWLGVGLGGLGTLCGGVAIVFWCRHRVRTD